MRDLHIIVSNKIATYLNRDGNIVCGNSNYRIVFTFDSEWDSHDNKIARFIWNDKYLDVAFTGDAVTVPVLSNTKQLKVGVYAGELSTTTPAVIDCLTSILCEHGQSEAEAEDVNGKIKYRLPIVTKADNGKLLQVADGEWAAVDLGIEQLKQAVDEHELAVDELYNKRDFRYYPNVSTAMDDINNATWDQSVSVDEGNVVVSGIYSTVKTVTLLVDVEETVQIDVNKSINLVLNGHTLSFTNSAAYLNLGTNTTCTIDGTAEESCIIKTCDSTSGTIMVVKTTGTSLTVKGGTYMISGENKTSMVFHVTADRFELTDARIDASTTTTLSGSVMRVMQLKGESLIKSCDIEAMGGNKIQCVYVHTGSADIEDSMLLAQEDCTSEAEIRTLYVNAGGVKVNMKRSKVYGSISNENVTGLVQAVSIWQNADVNIDDCEIRSESGSAITSSTDATGVYAVGTSVVHIANSTIFTDARGAHVEQSQSIGIHTAGTLFCKDTDATGTHSGISNSTGGKLYVSGGALKGFSHGGMYLSHGADGIAYIRDADIRCGGYEGQFTEEYATVNLNHELASLYLGGASGSNTVAYLDGCTINEANLGEHGFVLRSTDGEGGHRLYISNSNLTGYARVDSDSSKLYVGMGTNITEAMVVDFYQAQQSHRAEFNNELYRRHEGSEELNGKDFAALLTAKLPEAEGASF